MDILKEAELKTVKDLNDWKIARIADHLASKARTTEVYKKDIARLDKCIAAIKDSSFIDWNAGFEGGYSGAECKTLG